MAASPSTSATQTLAPSAENSSAASRPMPPPAPVITQTLPSRRPNLGSDEDVLDLGIPLERVHPELATEAGLLEAAEGRRVAHRAVRVDRQDAGVDRACDTERPRAALGPDRAREAVRRVVRDADGVVLVGEANHGGDG